MQSAASLSLILALAFLAETLTEYFFSSLLQGLRLSTSYLRYISAVVGVGLCLAFGVDAFASLWGLTPRYGPAGEVFTGLILGRGANFAHDFYTRFALRGGKV